LTYLARFRGALHCRGLGRAAHGREIQGEPYVSSSPTGTTFSFGELGGHFGSPFSTLGPHAYHVVGSSCIVS
jgi:hypothetical protein